MADGDSATVDVEFVVVYPQFVAAVDHLHGEGLVKLPQADVVQRQAVLLKQLGHRENRANAHLIRLAARDRDTAVNAQRLQARDRHRPPADAAVQPRDAQALLFGEFRIHNHLGGGAVRQLRSVPRRDGTAFDDGLQSSQAFRGGGPHALVRRHGDFRFALLAGFLVPGLTGAGHRHQLVRVPARLIRRRGAVLGLQSVLVHLLTRDAVAVCYHLRSLQHGHVDVRVHGDEFLITGAVQIHMLVLHQADGFQAAADNHAHAVVKDLLRRRGDRHQSGRTLPIDAHTGYGDRAAGAQRYLARDVAAGGTLLEGRAHDYIVHFTGVDARPLNGLGYRSSAERGARQIVEAAPVGLADRGARCRYNYRVC